MFSFVPRLALASLVVLGCGSDDEEVGGETTEATLIEQDAPRDQPSSGVEQGRSAQVGQAGEADLAEQPRPVEQPGQSASTQPEDSAEDQQPETAQLDPAEEPTTAAEEDSLIQGTVRGTVRAIDLAQGTVTIEGGGQQVDLQAHPSDLVQIDLGDEVALSFASYSDGSQWLATRRDPRQMLQTSTSVGQLTGEVEAIDADAGVIAVAEQTFRAHPKQLRAVDTGDAVTLSYADVEETAWVAELEVGGAAVASAQPPEGAEPPEGEEQAQAQAQTQGGDDIDWFFEPSG